MRIKHKFDMEIKSYEWLIIVAAIVIIALIIRGDLTTAINALTNWLPKPK